MSQSTIEIKTYYDSHANDKLKGFIEENIRVEQAWLTIQEWAPENPLRILEIGCGIGDISWRLKNYWQDAEVIGLDVSSKSLEIAEKLFGSPKLSFIEGPLVKGLIAGKFDLILMIDVYEHIKIEDRASLHEAVKDLLSDRGVMFLSFPTPRRQEWLRRDLPQEIQPVDEDVDIYTMIKLSEDIDCQVLLYKEVNIWHKGDYAHSILGKRDTLIPVSNDSNKSNIGKRILNKAKRFFPSDRAKRLAFVKRRLGIELD